MPSQGPQKRRDGYVAPPFSGVPNQKGTKSKWVASSLTSRGAQKRVELLRNYAFLGVPNAKRGEKIRNSYLTLAFSGAQKRAGLLCYGCILRGPQSKGKKIRKGYLIPSFSRAQKRAQ